MYTHHILLVLHLLAATIWVGGHLVLAIGFLPKALKHTDSSYISTPIEKVVSLKLSFLLTSICFAISAQTRVLPQLRKGNLKKLPEMAFHIICVTLLGVLMVIFGSLVRIGGL